MIKRILISSLALVLWIAGVSAQSKAYNIDGFFYHIIENPYFHKLYERQEDGKLVYRDNRDLPKEYNRYIICEYDNQGNATYFRYDRNGQLIPDPYEIYYDYFDGNDTIVSISTMGITDNCKGNVTIPSTVTIEGKSYVVGAIGDMAFRGCKDMTSIFIPASITYIPNGAFYGCDNLTSIVIDANNPVYDSRSNCNAVMETRKNSLIASCKSTVISPTANEIGEAACWGRKDLSTINLSNNITKIGKWAFLDCTGLTTAALSSSITAIETGMFEDCASLNSIEIPASVASIGDNAFHGCYNLTIEIPATATEISSTAFNGIGTLYWNSNNQPSNTVQQSYFKNLVFGDNVTEITWNVGCFGSVQSITIPSSVKRISRQAFYNIYNLETLIWNSKIPMSNIEYAVGNLKHIVFGDSVSYIEPTLFSRCQNLESIVVDSKNPYYDSRNNCNAVIGRTNTEIYYNDEQNRIQYYSQISKDYLVLGCKNTIIPNDVTSIGYCAFENKFDWDTRTSVTIPSSVKSIGDFAFAGCYSLESLHIPASVSFIAPGAFQGCFGLNSITVDPYNTVYNSNNNCNAIIEPSTKTLVLGCKNTVIPDGIEIIQDWAFSYAFASNLRDQRYPTLPKDVYSLTLPSSVKKIGYYAFDACDGLSILNVPQSVTEIGAYAFRNCNRLTSITIPDGIKTIKEGMLYGCYNLKSINIPQNVDTIEAFAFSGCGSVESIIIPEGVTVIKNGTFNNCRSLSYLSLPSTIVKFEGGYDYYGYGYENYSFGGCTSLLTAGPKGGGYNYEFNWKDTIPANAFRGLNNLKSVYIPRTIKAVYECDIQDNTQTNNSVYGKEFNNKYAYTPSLAEDRGCVGSVFYGCNELESVAVSFKNTKLMKYWRDTEDPELSMFKETAMDFNLYKLNPVKSVTILDDSIKDLTTVLTEGICELIVSEYVNYIDSDAFNFTPFSAALERLRQNPQDTYYYIPRQYHMESNLEKITVENGNTHYSSVDGVLLNADGSKLLLCPSKRKDGYRIPETVVEVAAESFKDCNGLKFVRIPGSVKLVGDRAFENCKSIDWITFEGSPEIGFNAFAGCSDIKSVAVHSNNPGIMHIHTTPQTIMTGDYNSISGFSNGLEFVKHKYNNELGRTVSEINPTTTTWSLSIVPEDILPGQYKMFVGVLPNSDQMPNIFSVNVVATLKDSTTQTILSAKQGPKIKTYNANGTQYDSVFIKDLEFPEECKSIEITLSSVRSTTATPRMVLDRIFLEPIGDNFPEDSYAGPFTRKAFNNAMLYVPDEAVVTFRAADGWKLFKSIAVDTSVDPIIQYDHKTPDNAIIYDMTGRIITADVLEQLQPGSMFIINGKKYLKR